MEAMAEQHIAIEANLTSNVQTSTVPDYPSHPMWTFLERFNRQLNSDDPAISGIDLRYE
jgi:adenosine deaminase